MVANRTLKIKAREYAKAFDISYPRALAELTAPGPGVPLHSKFGRDRFGFDPLKDRHLILTGDLAGRESTMERLFNRLQFKSHVERFIVDLTGGLSPLFTNLAADGSQGAAFNTSAAVTVLSNLLDNADMSEASGHHHVLAINGLPELLDASEECANLLSQLIAIDDPEYSMVLAGEWIASQPVPGGPALKPVSRLHMGPIPEIAGLSPRNQVRWQGLNPGKNEAIYHRAGFAPEKIGFSTPAQ